MVKMEENNSLRGRFKNYIEECIRVLKITKKPTMAEYKSIVKISVLGLALIGFLGFMIQLLKEFFFK